MTKKTYTPEQRLLYPDHVGLIKMKSTGTFIIDCDVIEKFIEKVNEKGIVRLKDYATSVHAFDIDCVEKVKVRDEHRQMIDKIARILNGLKSDNILSLNQCVEGLRSQPNPSLN